MAENCQNLSIQVRIDISLYIGQICMGFESDTMENENNLSIFSYDHGGMVSSLNHTFSWAHSNKRLTSGYICL